MDTYLAYKATIFEELMKESRSSLFLHLGKQEQKSFVDLFSGLSSDDVIQAWVVWWLDHQKNSTQGHTAIFEWVEYMTSSPSTKDCASKYCTEYLISCE
jgi:hypothetical protein